MKINLKPVLWTKDVDKDGNCPIVISITGGGKRTYYNTKIKCPASHWDGSKILKGVANFDIKNSNISNIINEAERQLLIRQSQGEQITVSLAKEIINPDAQVRGGNFLTYAATVIAAKDGATKRRYTVELDKLTEYAGNKLYFGQITPIWLSAYYKYLTSEKGKKRANSHNTAINAFKVIRHVFNEAKENKITSLYPFKDWKYPQYKKPVRNSLEQTYIDELFKILDSDRDKDIKLVTAFFLLEIYSGARVSDWHKFATEKINSAEDMVFTTTKTGTPIRIPVDVMPSLNRVVGYIKKNKLKYPHKDAGFANEKLETIREIVGYKGKFTTHLARHTCASIWINHGMSDTEIGNMLGITKKQVATYAHVSSNILRNAVKRLGGL